MSRLFFSFQWPCLDVNELQIITIWITSFIKFVFRSFTRFCLSSSLSPSSTPICISLHTVIQSQYIYTYICIDKRRADPKGYMPAASYSYDLRNWCLIRTLSMYKYLFEYTYEKNCQRKKKENLKWDTRHTNSIKKQRERESNCRSFIQLD